MQGWGSWEGEEAGARLGGEAQDTGAGRDLRTTADPSLVWEREIVGGICVQERLCEQLELASISCSSCGL